MGIFVILIDMFVYVLKIPYRMGKGIARSSVALLTRQPLRYQPHHYVCKNCGTANVFQPWTLGKEGWVKCPHCRQINKMPYGSNPKQAMLALFTVGSLLLLPWLIWTWLSKYNNTLLF